jgi:integrase/recombinase XerD
MATINGKGQAAVLGSEQIDRILEMAPDRYRPIFAVAAFTGCRISEARKLKGGHVDLVSSTLTFTETKTGVDRTVPISPKLRAILIEAGAQMAGDDAYLFPSPRTAAPVSRQCVGDELKAIAAALGYVGVSTHSFRRSAITALSDRGVPLKTIAAISGHRSMDQLGKYIEATPAKVAAAISLL